MMCLIMNDTQPSKLPRVSACMAWLIARPMIRWVGEMLAGEVHAFIREGLSPYLHSGNDVGSSTSGGRKTSSLD